MGSCGPHLAGLLDLRLRYPLRADGLDGDGRRSSDYRLHKRRWPALGTCVWSGERVVDSHVTWREAWAHHPAGA